MATERNVFQAVKSDKEIEEDRLAALKDWRKLAKKGQRAESDFEPGTYGYHEAIHTAWIMLENVATYLLEHPSIIKDPVCYRHASKAHDELFRLYQEISVEHATAIPEPTTAVAGKKPKRS